MNRAQLKHLIRAAATIADRSHVGACQPDRYAAGSSR